jgi:hypothetical protein
MRKLLASALLALSLVACDPNPTTPPAQTAPVTRQTLPNTDTYSFICEQLRSGATVRDAVDYEQGKGIDKEGAYDYVVTSIKVECPEYNILIQDYLNEGEK